MMACDYVSHVDAVTTRSVLLLFWLSCCYTTAVPDLIEFSVQYLDSDKTIPNLKCQSNDKSVTTISIHNITSPTPGQKMIWIDKGVNRPSVDGDLELTTSKHIFVNGDISMANDKNARLELVIIDYDFSKDQLFRCDIGISSQGTITLRNSTVLVNKRVTSSTTEAMGAVTSTDLRPANQGQGTKENSLESDGSPMIAVIVTLAIICVLLFVAVTLLVCRYWGRCKKQTFDAYSIPSQDNGNLSPSGLSQRKGDRPFPPTANPYLTRPPPPSVSPPSNKIYKGSYSYTSQMTIPYAKPQDAISQESSDYGVHHLFGSDGLSGHSAKSSPFYASVPITSRSTEI